jgi:hypothetical protein
MQERAARDKIITAITWTAIIGLGIADGAEWEPAKIIAGLLFLVWLILCAIPWLWWYFRGGERSGGEDA